MPTKYAEQVAHGLEALFSLQKQGLQMSFEMYEKSLETRYQGMLRARRSMQEVASTLSQQFVQQQSHLRGPLEQFFQQSWPSNVERWTLWEENLKQHYENVLNQFENSAEVMEYAWQRGYLVERQAQTLTKNYLFNQLNTMQDSVQGMWRRPVLRMATEVQGEDFVENPIPEAKVAIPVPPEPIQAAPVETAVESPTTPEPEIQPEAVNVAPAEELSVEEAKATEVADGEVQSSPKGEVPSTPEEVEADKKAMAREAKAEKAPTTIESADKRNGKPSTRSQRRAK